MAQERTRIAAEDVLIAACLAGLNLGLAWLLQSVRPPRLANRLLALVLVANAAHSILLAVRSPFMWSYAVNLLSLGPLLALPVVVPWQRLTGRALTAWIVASFAIAAVLAGTILEGILAPGLVTGAFPPLGRLPHTFFIHFAAALALVLLLDAYLAGRSPSQRSVALLFLVAFALRATALHGDHVRFASRWIFAADRAAACGGCVVPNELAALAVLTAAILVVPIALLAANARALAARAPRAWPRDLAVLAALAAGYALPLVGFRTDLEYALLRPVLLTYGILQVQLLAVDVRRQLVPLVASIAAGLLAALLFVADAGERLGLGATPSLGLGLFVSLGAGVLLAIPLLRLALARDGAPEPRRELVYRAALEAAAQEGQDLATSATLRALRHQLGLTEREHAALARNAAASADGLAAGALFRGRYRVSRRLGAGASGEVWLARDEELGRDVAVKRLAGHLRRDAKALARFESEVRLSRSLAHPNIVAVHDVELVGGDAYLVLEYAPGGSLAERLARSGPLPEAEARRLAHDVALALAALHAKGIVHRDVKPSNVLLAADGRALLADFTIAEEAVSGETIGAAGPAAVAGTPAYMSPEQARGVKATPASDVYGLGATLYAALAGRPPVDVEGLSDFEARLRVARDAPALPLPDATAATNDVLARALAKDPDERYRDGGRFADELA